MDLSDFGYTTYNTQHKGSRSHKNIAMITINEAIEIAAQLHECQDIVNDIRVIVPITQEELTFTTSNNNFTYFVNPNPYNHAFGVVSCLIYPTEEKINPIVKIIVQNPNTSSAAAKRAREENSKICWFMPFTNKKTSSGSDWGCIENEKLKRNSTKIFDQTSVAAWKKANPKPKKKRKAAASSSSSSSSSNKKAKIEKIVCPPLAADLGPDFKLSLSDAILIHNALHDPTFPKQVQLQSVNCVLKVTGKQKRLCVVIVDEATPLGYMKLMSQNKRKNSQWARRANAGESITWILPLGMDGKHKAFKTWGVIENGVLNLNKNDGCPLGIAK